MSLLLLNHVQYRISPLWSLTFGTQMLQHLFTQWILCSCEIRSLGHHLSWAETVTMRSVACVDDKTNQTSFPPHTQVKRQHIDIVWGSSQLVIWFWGWLFWSCTLLLRAVGGYCIMMLIIALFVMFSLEGVASRGKRRIIIVVPLKVS